MSSEFLVLVSVGSQELFGPLVCNFCTAVAKGKGKVPPTPLAPGLELETRFPFPQAGVESQVKGSTLLSCSVLCICSRACGECGVSFHLDPTLTVGL